MKSTVLATFGAIFQDMFARVCSLLMLGTLIAAPLVAQSGEVSVDRASVRRTISFYPYRGRWHGADVAYSIQLSPDRFLWLFGDTFVGSPDTQRIPGDSMPRNSIATTECPSGQPC